MEYQVRSLVIDVALSVVPMLCVLAFTWRLVWPRWKLIAKVIIHPCIYTVMAFYFGHWSVVFAWVHQVLLGLGGHIWFCHKHGFTWYAVENPDQYIAASKKAMASLTKAAQPEAVDPRARQVRDD